MRQYTWAGCIACSALFKKGNVKHKGFQEVIYLMKRGRWSDEENNEENKCAQRDTFFWLFRKSGG